MVVGLSVANGVADKLELLADGVLIASLGSRRDYAWDTSAVQEGTYELVARAIVEGQVVTSEPRTVVVDRTVPTVLARSPQPGDGNVPFGAPFQVTFSEPILPGSITDSGVSIADRNGASLSKQLVLSADGKALNIIVNGAPSLPVPISVSLEGLTDLAGNALPPAGAWSFTLQFVIDHTAPTIVRFEPAAGNDNVLLGAPFQVTFSEPIRPDTVNDGAVIVSGSGSVALSKHLALSADGRTLSITLAGQPALPASINIDLRGFTDLAGNILAQPAIGWSFTIPEWWQPWTLPVYGHAPNECTSASMALDSAGNPVVAMVDHYGARYMLSVKSWDGSVWRDLGGVLNLAGDVYNIATAVGRNDVPIVAWLEYVAGLQPQYFVYVAQWNGGEWSEIGGGPLTPRSWLNASKDPGPLWFNVALAADKEGRVTVVFPEWVTTGSAPVYAAQVAHFDVDKWLRPGLANTSSTRHARYVSVALVKGRPLVATFEEDVLRQPGAVYLRWLSPDGGWTSPYSANPVNDGVGIAYGPASLAIDAGSGSPVVAILAGQTVGDLNVYVKRWSSTAGGWSRVGGGVNPDPAIFPYNPILTLDGAGVPIVTWSARASQGVLVMRWDEASGWTRLGEPLNPRYRASTSLATAPDGTPVVAWVEDNVFLKKLNR